MLKFDAVVTAIDAKTRLANTEKRVAVCASTKSVNNTRTDWAKAQVFVQSEKVSEITLSAAEMRKTLAEFVKTHLSTESFEVQNLVVEHCMSALDGACVFLRPKK